MVSSSASAAEQLRELRIGLVQFPHSLHPAIEPLITKEYVLGFVHRRLTVYDADWKLVCQLCTEVPTVANGRVRYEDSVAVVHYTLRPDARWGDGVPLTTEDVQFAWDFARDPTSGVSNATLFHDDVFDLQVNGKLDFTIKRKRTLCEAGQLNDFRILPAHLERARMGKGGPDRPRSLYQVEPTNPGLWEGPYRIAKRVPGSSIVLERNDYWWGEKPYFDRIVLVGLENSASLESSLRAGQFDLVPGEVGMQIDQASALARREAGRLTVQFEPMAQIEVLHVNHEDPILADLRVRKALLYAIDRETINKQIFEGKQEIARTTVPSRDSVFVSEGVATYPYDKEKAVALLEEAGFTDIGAGGIRRNKDGVRLSFEVATTSGLKTRELVIQVLQNQWREVGVELRIHMQPPRVLLGETLRKRRFPHFVMSSFAMSPHAIPETTMLSSSIPREANNFAGQNYGAIVEPRIDAAIKGVASRCDALPEEWASLQRAYADTLPHLPLWFRVNAQITVPWLTGVRQTGHQYPGSLWAERWGRK